MSLSPSSSPSSSAAPAVVSPSAAPAVVSPSPEEPEMMHKIKVIQFLGRTTPVVLQNDNGPCPLLAICNVLLLKNNLSLSPDIPEVSQQKLLTLVADRIFESNSNIDDKDTGYVKNQQQNIADAIDMLPRLTTGIDVNIRFRRINDFEFTRECAIFDLLDIPLYHGWIVDPQDSETANAIGFKSYNTLMGDLVALETQSSQTGEKKAFEEDSIDFVAATTAALGVPSPCLSRGVSFDELPVPLPDLEIARKGDIEEEAELDRVMKLSKSDIHTSSADDTFPAHPSSFVDTDGMMLTSNSEPVSLDADSKRNSFGGSQILLDAMTLSDSCEVSNKVSETVSQEAVCLASTSEQESPCNESVVKESVTNSPTNIPENDGTKTCLDIGTAPLVPSHLDSSDVHKNEADPKLSNSTLRIHVGDEQNDQKTFDFFSLSTLAQGMDSGNSATHHDDEPKGFSSSLDACEPIYEGEESILESEKSEATSHQNREPVYEGEVVLAEQGSKRLDVSDTKKDEISPKDGELIQIFLKNSASQLTIYGLFCLQEELKERELCVFFRNNHFNTMFKFEGELYILATDLGYLNQPDLVWEKLNEVNGDTVYMTSNFKEFKVENQGNNSWDEQHAMTNTADYLASIDNSIQEDSSFNSDLQLAIALQQQEFEQQSQQRQNNARPPSVPVGTLVTGPQVPRNSGKYASNSSRQEPKSSKDKCVIM